MRFLNKNQIFFKKQSTLQSTTVAQAAHTKKRNKITLSNKQQQKKKKKRKPSEEEIQKKEVDSWAQGAMQSLRPSDNAPASQLPCDTYPLSENLLLIQHTV